MDFKYYLQKEVTIKIDRKIGSKHPKWGFVYPINYGLFLIRLMLMVKS